MTETRERYVTSATPVLTIEPDPVLRICLQVESGELNARAATRQIAEIHCRDRLAFLAGFIEDEYSSRHDRCAYCGAPDGQCSH
jgi:hypothetical protein